jgi:hypothetical protein
MGNAPVDGQRRTKGVQPLRMLRQGSGNLYCTRCEGGAEAATTLGVCDAKMAQRAVVGRPISGCSRLLAASVDVPESRLESRLRPGLAWEALYPKNPRLDAEKLARLGKIVARAVAGMPNQEHRVAPY